MNDQVRAPVKETILSEFKLALRGRKLEGADKAPTLRVDIFENNPRLRVKTNLPNDRNNGYIDAAMTSMGFYSVLESLRIVADSNGPYSIVLGLDGHPFINGQRAKEKLPVASIKLEKYDDGRITIVVSGGNKRPVIDFDVILDDYHHFRDGNGQPMDKRLAYQISTRAYIEMLKNYVPIALRNYVVPAWQQRNQQQQQGGGQQGGYQQNRGQGQQGNWGNQNAGYQQRPQQPQQQPQSIDSWDNDVPL